MYLIKLKFLLLYLLIFNSSLYSKFLLLHLKIDRLICIKAVFKLTQVKRILMDAINIYHKIFCS